MNPIERSEAIRKEIKSVTDFTSAYWWPAYEQAEANKMNTPTLPAIILDIIEKRGRYVAELRKDLEWSLSHN